MAVVRAWIPVLLLPCLARGAPAGGTYHYQLPSPMGDLLYARPQVRWKIWSDDGLKITEVRLVRDGKEVTARYDEGLRAVVHTPADPLAVGTHKFECTVTLNRRHTAHQDWTVRVLPDATMTLAEPTPSAVEATQALNRIRARLGLDPVKTDLGLTAASAFQTRTIQRTGSFDHVQNVPTGATPGDRAMLFGYGGAVSELLSSGIASPSLAVRSLFDAPYHRIPLLVPGRPDLGASVQGDYTALLVSEAESGMSVSPAHKEADVPTDWDGVETPSPMRDSGLGAPYGYPVVAALFGTNEWSLLKAELTGADGKPVKTVLRHRGNDPFAARAVILVPAQPLRPNTTYAATVSVLSGEGTKTKRWTFTTAAR